MTPNEIEIIESTKRLRLKLGDRLTHYWIVAFLSLLPIMSIWFIVEDLTGNGKGVKSIYDFMTVGLISLTLVIFFYILQSRRLNFYQINTSKNEKEIEQIISLTTSQRDWKIIDQGTNYIIARRQGNGTGSWGEQITIVFKTGQVLINSICDPKKPSSVASFGQNKKNIRTLEENLNNKI